jgi:hypothetical protein
MRGVLVATIAVPILLLRRLLRWIRISRGSASPRPRGKQLRAWVHHPNRVIQAA